MSKRTTIQARNRAAALAASVLVFCLVAVPVAFADTGAVEPSGGASSPPPTTTPPPCPGGTTTTPAPGGTTGGGATPPSGDGTTSGCGPTTGPPGKATLRAGGGNCGKIAVAPSNAPPAIVKAIAAANKICSKPYIWGGGHGKFEDRGYDCSGAVSYLLHAAGLLNSPLDSGRLAALIRNRTTSKTWAGRGGKWITVAANGGHTYIDVAGLRFDTSKSHGRTGSGTGPRWAPAPLLYDVSRYTILHPRRF